MTSFFKVYLTIFWLCFFLPINAQGVKIRGKITKLPAYSQHTLFLKKYYGQSFNKVDSVIVSTDGNVALYDKSGATGLYAVSLDDSTDIQLILSPKESPVFRATYYDLLQARMELDSSFENQAYTHFTYLLDSINNVSYQLSTEELDLSKFHPKYLSIKTEFAESRTNLLYARRDALRLIRQLYPTTFAAFLSTVADHPLKIDDSSYLLGYDNLPAFLNAHYLDNLPFNDERVLLHPLLTEMLVTYLGEYSDNTVNGIKAATDSIMSKLRTNNKVRAYVLDFLGEQFLKKNIDQAFTHLVNQYGKGHHFNFDEPYTVRMNQILGSETGSSAPELNLQDIEAKTISLSSIASKHKVTMLYFWSSSCKSCELFHEAVKQLYGKYHSMGLEVYAVSLEPSFDTWKQQLAKIKTPWINVMQQTEGELPAMLYRVDITPKIFLINGAMQIVAKDLNSNNLESTIVSFLKQTP
ncbi:MAG: TlpA disulfide reductase family protein [Chitinophagales bacterium]|nr:TlpA disulfide reductase family protein [Chitinophagales bacterium]